MDTPQDAVPGRRRSGSEVRVRRTAVGVRLTPAERAVLDGLAADAGMSAAGWLRQAGIGGRPPSGGSRSADLEALRRLAGQAALIGDGIRRLARRTDGPAADAATVAEAAAELRRLRSDLRRVLGVGDVAPGCGP